MKETNRVRRKLIAQNAFYILLSLVRVFFFFFFVCFFSRKKKSIKIKQTILGFATKNCRSFAQCELWVERKISDKLSERFHMKPRPRLVRFGRKPHVFK